MRRGNIRQRVCALWESLSYALALTGSQNESATAKAAWRRNASAHTLITPQIVGILYAGCRCLKDEVAKRQAAGALCAAGRDLNLEGNEGNRLWYLLWRGAGKLVCVVPDSGISRCMQAIVFRRQENALLYSLSLPISGRNWPYALSVFQKGYWGYR